MTVQVFELLKVIITLLPIAALIWKASGLNSRVDTLERDVKRIEAKHEDEARATDSILATFTNMLNDIKITVARIETKLQERERND